MARYIKYVGGPKDGQVDRVYNEDEHELHLKCLVQRYGLPAPKRKLTKVKEYTYVATGQVVKTKESPTGHAEVFEIWQTSTQT